ncbi:MAG: S8 family serine peptidase [Methanothrix sp.]|nr:S8 family serine peptidase [Methanothrix sp.]
MAAFSCAQAAKLPTNADQKIDSALAEMLDQGNEEKIPIIVMLNANSNQDLLIPEDLISNELTVKYVYRLIPGLAGEANGKAIKKIAESDRVSGIFFDGRTQIFSPDKNSSLQESIFQEEYISPAQIIKADKLWEKGIDGQGITVAVIDSGIDKNHPDLTGKVIAEKNFLADEITADDLLGHGTMVAGIIAGSGAASNGRYKGIAPGAKLISVKVIDGKGDGKVSDIIAGIEWAVYNGADVLSLSLGGINLGETNPPITMAADNAAGAGVVVCVAAGNRNSSEAQGQVKGAFAKGIGNSDVGISQQEQSDDKNVLLLFVPIVLALPPGLIDSPGDGVKVITVGAADNNGRMAGFSGSGPTRDDRIKPDAVAPGVDIISTVPSGLKRPVYVDDYYARESGTSLSTPVAAGLCALLLQANGNLTAAGVKAAMTRGATKLNNTLSESYEEYYQGAGMLDALSSYDLLENSSNSIGSSSICGVIPDRWTAGRWAYLPAGKGVYVGLDTGADRPQKKIYALAPGDDDWNLRFVFFSDMEIKNLKTAVKGGVSDWVSLQALPETILANDQKVFAASITVPQDALPGLYNGTIEISKENENLLEIPISVNVASLLNISRGVGNKTGSLIGNQWRYYYLEMMPGTSEFEASLEWQQDTNLDLFLLSPTSEYYTDEKNSRPKIKKIQAPPSGKWLIAVHSENATHPANYTLHVERSQLETAPIRWNLDSAAPGTSTKTQFAMRNLGLTLRNLSYGGVIENTTSQDLKGTVLYKKVWEYTVNATKSTKKLSASLFSDDKTNSSELMLVFENPGGEPVDALLDSGDLGPLEMTNPEIGAWKVKVYGYDVPDEGQPFRILLKRYAEDPWSWIETSGPEKIDSNENASLEANLTIPKEVSLPRLDGYIKISSDSHNFEIPVSLTIAGTRLEGLTEEEVMDSDNDGLFDMLTLDFGLNITAPGEYRLKGVLSDCRGGRIEAIDSSFALLKSGGILVNVSGTDIWRNGKCGPMMIQNLILYDKSGSYIDRFDKEITINREPKQFQAPAAYLTGEYVNRTAQNSIAIGVNVTAIKPGSFELQGTIVDDDGMVLGKESVQSDLHAGNATMLLQFDPSRFMKEEAVSAVHLVDLVLSRGTEELERIDYAWSSENMDPQAFKAGLGPKSKSSGLPVVKLDGASGIRLENGTAVIS